MNSYVKATPMAAGAAAVTVLTGQLWLLALAVGLVVLGTISVRIMWRRGRGLSDR